MQMRSGDAPTVENALLANRLFGMSLHDWAGPGADVERNRLRAGWQFVIDDESNQTFMPSPTNNYGDDLPALDAVVLRALEHPTASPEPTAAGDFIVDRPGLFFNQVDVQPYEAEVPEGETCSDGEAGCARVWGAHFPPELSMDNNGEYFVPLVSNPGWRWGLSAGSECTSGDPACPDDICSDGAGCSTIGEPVAYNYRRCLGTTLDAVKGSSGGAFGGTRRRDPTAASTHTSKTSSARWGFSRR